MIDVQPPNTGDTGKLGPWILSTVVTAVLGIVTALWAAFKGKDAKLVGGLEAQLIAKNTEIERLNNVIVKLGEKLDTQRADAEAKLDAERAAHKSDQDRALAAILHNDWHEAPTGMRAVCELVAGSSIRPGPPEPPRPPGKPPVRIPR